MEESRQSTCEKQPLSVYRHNEHVTLEWQILEYGTHLADFV